MGSGRGQAGVRRGSGPRSRQEKDDEASSRSLSGGDLPRDGAGQRPGGCLRGRSRPAQVPGDSRENRGEPGTARPRLLPNGKPLPPARGNPSRESLGRDAAFEWPLRAVVFESARPAGTHLGRSIQGLAGRRKPLPAGREPLHPSESRGSRSRSGAPGVVVEQLSRDRWAMPRGPGTSIPREHSSCSTQPEEHPRFAPTCGSSKRPMRIRKLNGSGLTRT